MALKLAQVQGYVCNSAADQPRYRKIPKYLIRTRNTIAINHFYNMM